MRNEVEMICWQAEARVALQAASMQWQKRWDCAHSGGTSTARQVSRGAAELVRAYLKGLPRGSPARKRMPSHTELIKCGRHDVRYAMQVRSTGVFRPGSHDVPACNCTLAMLAAAARMCMRDRILHVSLRARAASA